MVLFRPTKMMATLLIFVMLPSVEVVATDLSCRICEHLVFALRVSEYQIESCRNRLPAKVCTAVDKTIATMVHRRYEKAVCTPGFCARYTAECSCAISKVLMEVAQVNKQQPKDEFEKRLHLACTQLDFLDPPCNMIVDEYAEKMHELALNGVPTEEACREIGLCP